MKTIRILFTFIFAFVAVIAFSSGVSFALETPILPTAIVVAGASYAFSGQIGLAFSGLNREIWLAEIVEGFYANDMFITECRDFTAFVDNNTLNLAEAGVNPDVLLNNTTYPIPIADRTDLPIAIPIDRFDTENTSIKDAGLVELAYAKMQSVIYGHKQALRMKFMEKAAHAIAPAANTTYTPLMVTTGTNNGTGYKRMTFQDIINLETRFDEAEIPAEGRIIVLSAQHKADLRAEDKTLFNQLLKENSIYGFKMYNLSSSRLPKYNLAGAKKAFGSVSIATDQTASIAFHKDEVCRATGEDKMFHGKAEDNPATRQDVIGFSRRGIVLPIRDKGVAAIYSDAV